MSQFGDDLAFSVEQFSGQARLFPLPNLVLFPHVIQPLHIFEPRYVEMFHDAIQGDRLVAMALLEQGWEKNYEGRPPIARTVCLGRILTWQAQAGGRYNVLLLGLRRARLLAELPPARSFREAELRILQDEYPPSGASERLVLHRKLVEAFEAMLPRIRDAAELFNQLSMNNISLGALTDVISFAIDVDIRDKQALLSEPNVDQRARTLLAHLHAAAQHEAPVLAGFPPAFSAN